MTWAEWERAIKAAERKAVWRERAQGVVILAGIVLVAVLLAAQMVCGGTR